ncbi:hypothetical protein BVRB_004900 [Beta vulgaris subsp. vulgaris]|uniref:Uncharacterized protein n=1 Tax=Beta vulgaris subsp. vulgaris TaxID=3555 RepID=A0A0J8B469_BETVV|nr:hypothetical protein BVRB_004900 [Beta vulgaris subsp. vulgaris]
MFVYTSQKIKLEFEVIISVTLFIQASNINSQEYCIILQFVTIYPHSPSVTVSMQTGVIFYKQHLIF